MTFYWMCKPSYRVGMTVFWIGVLLSGVGLLLGVIGKGWAALLFGIGCVVFGMVASQIPLVILANEVKLIDESFTPKQATDLVLLHLRKHGDDVEDTQVFLGRFGGEVEVVKKYRKSAERGDPEAQHRLASCYRQGFGVLPNEVEAAKWYRRAADQGYSPPQGF